MTVPKTAGEKCEKSHGSPSRKEGGRRQSSIFAEKLEKVSSKLSLTTCCMLHWFFYPKSNTVNVKRTKETEQSSDYNKKEALTDLGNKLCGYW